MPHQPYKFEVRKDHFLIYIQEHFSSLGSFFGTSYFRGVCRMRMMMNILPNCVVFFHKYKCRNRLLKDMSKLMCYWLFFLLPLHFIFSNRMRRSRLSGRVCVIWERRGQLKATASYGRNWKMIVYTPAIKVKDCLIFKVLPFTESCTLWAANNKNLMTNCIYWQ